MLLHVRYPDAYPDEAPMLDIQTLHNATSSHPDFSVSDDKEQLLASLEETVQENLGIAMVFTLVTTLKDAAEQLVADRKAAKEKVREEAALAAEREENKKFHGTPVNPETFLKWRADFMQEMEDIRNKAEEDRLADLKKARVKDPSRCPDASCGRRVWWARSWTLTKATRRTALPTAWRSSRSRRHRSALLPSEMRLYEQYLGMHWSAFRRRVYHAICIMSCLSNRREKAMSMKVRSYGNHHAVGQLAAVFATPFFQRPQ